MEPNDQPSPPSEAAVTVVLIADFESGDDRGWNDLRVTLGALAGQDFRETMDVVLVETEDMRDRIPSDLFEILPSLRVAFVDANDSYDLRNAGIELAGTDFVVTLDGDCAPGPNWVRTAVETLRADPQLAVVSGRTLYAGDSLLARGMTLLGRSYIEEDRESRHIANHGAGFRRSLVRDFPLPRAVGIFGSQLQAEKLLAAGRRLRFEPTMEVRHAYDGWAFERDQRPLLGYGVLRIRMEDDRVANAKLARLGILSVPIFFVGRLLRSWRNSLRYYRRYDVRAWELPAVFVYAVIGGVMEIPGMLRAVRGQPPHATRFR